jgi:hypothetical protein
LKQGYSFGCLELCSEALSDFPHTWTFVWKSSVQCRGLLSSVFKLQRASKLFSWCRHHVLRHRMSLVILNRHLKWLGPRIPEGAYYA